MNILSRPPLGVLRQFARAAFADRLFGDEMMRMTMARVDIDPTSSSASAVDLVTAFVGSWREALRVEAGTAKPAPFSDASLLDALPRPPSDRRIVLLLVDVLGFSIAEAGRIVGSDEPGRLIGEARKELAVQADASALVIEDEPLIAADLRAILELLGVTVAAEARNAPDAVRLAGEVKPGVILTDYNLDGRATGIDAAVQIEAAHECPVIFITGYPDRVLQGEEIEPDFVISKPYSADAVRAAVVHCLDARRG